MDQDRHAKRSVSRVDGRLPEAHGPEFLEAAGAGDGLWEAVDDAISPRWNSAHPDVPLPASPGSDPVRVRRALSDARRRTERRWCIPPAIRQPHGETLEGTRLLEEHKDRELAYLLWVTLRDVLLWSAVDPDRRAGLFAPAADAHRLASLSAAGEGQGLTAPMFTLAALLARPAQIEPEELTSACVEVSRWAREHGAVATAIAFAQAAALVMPEDAGPALTVGALLRVTATDAHALARAESWLRRAVSLARRRGDWKRYTEAYVELGALYARRDLPKSATRAYVVANRAARRHGFRAVRASSFHGLMRIAMEEGDLDAGARYAKRALRAYGRGHVRIPDVMLDVAYLWVLQGRHARAAAVLQKQLLGRYDPRERAYALALLARAMSGRGAEQVYRAGYQDAWSKAWSIINRPGNAGENHARAILQLAHASLAMDDRPRMDHLISLAAAEPSHVEERPGNPLHEVLKHLRRTHPVPEIEAAR